MSTTPTMPRPPLVLVANGQEWLVRSVESLIGPNGYAVLRAYDGPQAIERARSATPDAVLLDIGLPGIDGFEVARRLRTDPEMGAGTPILLTSSGPWARSERLEAFRAGAWDVLTLPVDSEELLLKLEVFARAKFHTDAAREAGMLDHATGLYNIRGLLRRVAELAAEATRHERSLACIVLAPDVALDTAADFRADAAGLTPVEALAGIFRETVRVYDSLGRIGTAEFVILAPSTGPEGALTMARRLSTAAEQAGEAGTTPGITVRAGCYAVRNLAVESVEPVDLLVRATTALRLSQSDPDTDRVRFFAATPVTWTQGD